MLADFFAGQFDAYYAALDKPVPLWLFVHVPKTAGSSLNADISALIKPATHIVVQGPSQRVSREVLFDGAVDDFLQRHAARNFRFVGGHLWARNTAKLRAALPETQCFTMLRDPLARIVSDYRYQRSELNPAHQDFVAKNPDFATFIARPHVHNKTARALVPPEMIAAGDVEAAVQMLLGSFAFIGVQERYDLGLRALTAALTGVQRTQRAQVRVNKETPQSKVVPTPAQMDALRLLNAFDIGLVAAFSQRWDAIADALETYLEHNFLPADTAAAALTSQAAAGH